MVSSKQVKHSLEVLKRSLKCVILPLAMSLLHISNIMLLMSEQRKNGPFAFLAAAICLSGNNVSSVMSPITSAMHHEAFSPLDVPRGKSAAQWSNNPH